MFLTTPAVRRRAGLLLTGLGLLTLPAAAQNTSWSWARGLHGTGYDAFGSVATDAAGNVYAAGSFEAAALLGTSPLTGQGQSDALVAKFDAQGNLLWSRRFGTTESNWAEQVVTDAQGNVYVGGHFEGSASFGAFTLSAGPYGSGLFVIKLDAQGTVLWAQQAVSSNFATTFGLQPDGAGGAYVAGTYTNGATMGSSSFTGFGSILARLDAQGQVQWVRQQSSKATGYPDQFTGNALAVSGNYVYAAGSFSGTVAFGSTTLTAPGSSDAWLASYDAQGTLRWLRQGGNASGYDVALGLAADTNGHVYVSGEFEGPVAFGTLTLPGALNNSEACLFKFDEQGTGLWARQLTSPGHDYAAGLALDAQRNVYVVGGYSSGALIGNTALLNRGQLDAFVASYSPQGGLRWVQTAGGPGNDQVVALSAPDASSLLVAGGFDGTSTTFGPTTLTNANGSSAARYDGFVARLTGLVNANRQGQPTALSLFPNPATDRVQLPGLPAGSRAEVLDALGRCVRPAVSAAELSVQGLPTGVYTVRATDAQGQPYTGRVLVP